MSKKNIYRKKKAKSRPHFFSVPAYQGEQHFPSQIELVKYNQQGMTSQDIPIEADLLGEVSEGQNNWFIVRGLSEENHINRICRSIGLHGFDIRDLISNQQVIKVTVYEGVVFVILSGFRLMDDSQLDEIKLAFALGENFLISFQETQDPIFDEVKKAITDDNLQVRFKPMDFLLYVLFNAANGMNINAMMQLEDELIEIEEQLIHRQNPQNVQELLHLRRIHYTQIKRSYVALREEYGNLTHAGSDLIRSEDVVYFHNFDDRLRSALGNLESYHESLISLSDVYYNNNNLIMNDIIKRLTIVSTIFIPLTFLVGVWGMNFKYMPETDWKYGYLFAWASFFFLAIVTFVFMKRKKWF